MAKLFDTMAADRARAMVEQRNPVGWKVNQAALAALRADGTIAESHELPVEAARVFGLPLTIDSADVSDTPHAALLTVDPAADA